MFPHQNPLPKPEIIKTPPFEVLLQQVQQDILAYFTEHAPDDATALGETLGNEAELLTKFVEAFTVILQNHIRQLNGQAQQMFGMYATDDDMIDLIVSQLGVTRQVLDPGDPSAFPPIPPVMESNDSLLSRYYLAAYALASTGTRSGYRFHAMTLGGRPEVQIDSHEPKRVVVTYEYLEHEMAGLTKDAQARQVSPGVVDCFILTHEGNGMPSSSLIEATQSYLARDDIAQETDLITVKSPEIRQWQCEAKLYTRPGPDADVVLAAAEKAVRAYALKQHRLGGSIEPSMLYSVLLESTGAHRGEIIQPAQPLRCAYSEAPYLESVKITVGTENV
ncbi:baseplate J/gp47 family protein [Vibrio gazogenes]|uniref:Phage-related baseplate assembly protein n=1 Tax=Vibrio gazogenes DSM 21264 = NBRC 103151 TaxID=1123492 RepID=A0A1M5AKK1_VIBGA|nr:baseplate J/gp47 family protein [Vibrio gazogenes]USP12624.1 baseplate J/gp47 family protein [Vibrio gazogenes]SHF30830.1 Phage-related baseplate assembly protein [Vibrio gazogenes DSM 21264] [Vibrio gazogenes DSM 21264 = NBRC 103151]SJN55763.1 Baseplate J-like protein [Vibrio gazogenes]